MGRAVTRRFLLFPYIPTKIAHNIKAGEGGNMDDKFLCGMLLGVIGGAVIATNSAKARQMVREGQEQVKQKVDEISKETSKKN